MKITTSNITEIPNRQVKCWLCSWVLVNSSGKHVRVLWVICAMDRRGSLMVSALNASPGSAGLWPESFGCVLGQDTSWRLSPPRSVNGF